MPVTVNNTTPTSGAGTLLTRTQGGVYDLVITNNSGQVAYLGTSSAVTSTNGCPIPSGGVLKLTGIAGGPATSFYVVVAAGAASGAVGYVITTST